ncbi:MAG: flagellar protein FlaG [Lachnospiraceae bacterium]|nr:flagellar protein FlaG [Lachnospiraceae bacterium]
MEFDAINSVKRAPEPAKQDADYLDIGWNANRIQATETKPVVDSSKANAKKQEEEDNENENTPYEAKEPSKMSIESAVSGVNNRLTATRCEYSYDEITKRVSIKVYDKANDELIREVPPEKSLEMLQKMWELVGLIVDEKL